LASVFDCSQRIHRLLDLLCLASITLFIIITLLSTLRTVLQNWNTQRACLPPMMVVHKIWSYWWVCFDVFCSPTIQPELIWSNYGKRDFMFTSLFLNKLWKEPTLAVCRCREVMWLRPSQNAFALVYVCHR
jgi:hypothetical protein